MVSRVDPEPKDPRFNSLQTIFKRFWHAKICSVSMHSEKNRGLQNLSYDVLKAWYKDVSCFCLKGFTVKVFLWVILLTIHSVWVCCSLIYLIHLVSLQFQSFCLSVCGNKIKENMMDKSSHWNQPEPDDLANNWRSRSFFHHLISLLQQTSCT